MYFRQKKVEQQSIHPQEEYNNNFQFEITLIYFLIGGGSRIEKKIEFSHVQGMILHLDH